MRSLSYSNLPSLRTTSAFGFRDSSPKQIASPPKSSWVVENERGPILYIGAGTDIHPLIQFPNVKTFLYIDGLPGNRFHTNSDPKHYGYSIKNMIWHMRQQLPCLGEGISMDVQRGRRGWKNRISQARSMESMTSLFHGKLATMKVPSFRTRPQNLQLRPQSALEIAHFHFSTGQVIEYWFNVQDTDIPSLLCAHPERRAIFNSCSALLVHGWLPVEASIPKDQVRTVYHTRVFQRICNYDWGDETVFEPIFHWNFCTEEEAEEFLKWKGYTVPTGFWTFERKREEPKEKQRASVSW